MVNFALNEAPLAYWKMTGYSSEEAINLCAELDKDWMVALINFHIDGGVQYSISSKTWERQEGHYPTILKFFSDIAKHPACRGKQGSLIIWLEDGLWEPHIRHTFRSPMLSFGRHRSDQQSFLIPDPAFIGSNGYKEDLTEIAKWNAEMPFIGKKPIAFWRGAATGICIENELWVDAPRGRLVLYAKMLDRSDMLDAKITKIDHLTHEQKKIMSDSGVIGEVCDFKEFLKYRFVIDVDGYCCAWKSLFLKLASNSLVLKIESDYAQWYFDQLVPWKHYIQLHHKLQNFESVYKWLMENQEVAEQIAKQANLQIQNITYEGALEETSLLCASILSTHRAR